MECCSTKPTILCRVCKLSACMQHSLSFKRLHPPADMLSPNGREMFLCGEIALGYVSEAGIVILQDIKAVRDAYVPTKS